MIHPSARLGLVVGLLGFWCAGCSGTRFGEQLAERLSEPDNPVEDAVVPNGAAASVPSGEQLPEQPSQPGDSMEEASPASPGSSPPPPAATPLQDTSPSPAGLTVVPSPPPPLNPTPYRLLLRLPAADPAAPAEAVTQALRAAGILFEVETIERLPDQPANPAPSAPLDPSP